MYKIKTLFNKKVIALIAIMMGAFTLTSCRDEIDPGTANTGAGILSLIIEFFSVAITAILGGAFAILGFFLIYKGYTGEIELFMSGEGWEARLANASPGIVLVVLGFILIWRSRADIKIKK